MALQTATNPDTGEKVALVGGEWLPVSQSATNAQGQKAYLVNNQWMMEDAKPAPERTMGQAFGDVGAKLVSGLGGLAQFPGQVYGLATGEIKKPEFAKTGLYGLGQEMQDWAKAHESEGLKAKEAATAAKVAQAEQQGGQFAAFKTQAAEVLKDPAQLTAFLAEQAPQAIPSIIAAMIPGVGPAAAGEIRAAQLAARTATSAAAKEAAEVALKDAVANATKSQVARGTSAAVRTGAVQQGADVGSGTYENLYKTMISQGSSPEEAADKAINLARAAGVGGAALSLLAAKLPGAQAFERALAGEKLGKGAGAAARIGQMAVGAAKEIPGEQVEEVGGKFLQNVAQRQVNPEQSLTEGLGQTAAQAAIGAGGMGAIGGIRSGRAAPVEEKPEAPAVPDISQIKPPPEKMEAPKPYVAPPSLTGTDLTSQMQGTAASEDVAGMLASQREQEKARAAQEAKDKAEMEAVKAEIAKATPLTEKPGYNMLRGSEDRNAPFMAAIEERRAAEEAQRAQEQKTKSAAETKLAKDVEARTNAIINPMLAAAKKTQLTNQAEVEGAVNEMYKDFKDLYDQEQSTPLTVEQTAALKEKIRARLYGEEPAAEGAFSQTPFKTFLMTHGINPKDVQDVFGDKAVQANRALPGIIRGPNAKRGEGLQLDMLAEKAKESGFLSTDEDTNDLMDKIKQEFSGAEQIPMDMAQERAEEKYSKREDEQLQSKASELGIDTRGMEAPQIITAIGRIERRRQPALEKIESRKQRYARDVEGFSALSTEEQDRIANTIADQFGVVEPRQAEIEAMAVEDTGVPPSGPQVETLESKSAKGGWDIDPAEQRVEKELTGKNFMQVTQWAIDNAPNAFYKTIAEKVQSRLREYQRKGVQFDFTLHAGASRSSGMRNRAGAIEHTWERTGSAKGSSMHMHVNGAAAMNNQAGYAPGVQYDTILHELLHAALRTQTRFMPKNDPLYKDLIELNNKVIDQFNKDAKAGALPQVLQDYYKRENNALATPDELISWGLTDTDVQKWLDGIKVGEKSIFTKLVELMRKIIGLGKPYESALERLVRTTDSMLGANVEAIAGNMRDQGFALAETKNQKPISNAEQQSLFKEVSEKTSKAPSGAAGKVLGKAKAAAHEALQKREQTKAEDRPHISAELNTALNKVFAPHNKTIVTRIDGLKDSFWKKVAQGVADQYRSIKDYSQEAYMLARLSKSVDGALEGLLVHGHVYLDSGALNIKQNTKGLLDAMKPLGKEVDNYMQWIALNREARLPIEKRSSDLASLVPHRAELASGTLNGKPRLEVYQQVQKDMNALNKSVLDIALKQGLIDQKGYDTFSSDLFYVPFYRAMEDGDIQGASTASGLGSQYFSKELKGQSDKPFGDLMENTLMNWSHILSASMKNKASNKTMEAAMEAGAAAPNLKVGLEWKDGKVYSTKSGEMVGNGELRGEMTTSTSKAIKTMINGRPAYFEVYDPMLMDSISSIGYMGPNSKLLDVAKDFKNYLQFGVTLSPAFKVRNLFRDSISALAVSDLKRDPFANIVEGWIASDKNNPAHISALAGGAIFNFGTTNEGNQAKNIKRLIKMGVAEDTILDTPEKVKAGLKKAFDIYQEWGNKSEAANRMALYNQMKAKGMSHLEASFAARDMLDFSMQGSWQAFRLVSQVVPFLNARVQGLYKLGRDGLIPTSRVFYNTATGKPLDQTDVQKAQSFGYTTLAVAMASMALYMAFKDDEDYQKRDEWDRDNFWWFKVPGIDYAFRVPKPFEIGAIGTLAERTLEQIVDSGSEGKQFEDSIKRMLADTFAMNPIPQAVKPLIDLYANKDSFTGAPIETAGMERLSKQERATDTTSPLAKAIGAATSIAGEKGELSPVQVDYAIKAYFGWLGGTVAQTSHYAVMPFKDGEYPDTKLMDRVSLGFVKSLPSDQSRYVTAFYENNKQISQAFADMRHYSEAGEMEKVAEIMDEKGDKIALSKLYDQTSKQMANVRKQIRVVTNSEDMSGSDKREEITRLKEILSMYAQNAEEVRKSTK